MARAAGGRPRRVRIEFRFADRNLTVAPAPRSWLIAAVALFVLLAGAGWLIVGSLAHYRLLRARAAEVHRVAAANAALRGDVDRLRQALDGRRNGLAALQPRVAALEQELAAARARLTASQARLRRLQDAQDRTPATSAAAQPSGGQQAAKQSGEIARLSRALARADRQRKAANKQRAALAARLVAAQADLAAAKARDGEIKLALARLQERLHRLAAAGPPAPRRVAKLAAPGRWHRIARVLAATGVDVAQFLGRFGLRPGVGGPFIPASRAPRRPSAARQAAFRMMLHALPLTAPLHSDYRVSSPFGDRVDPFNGRPAFHPGIDLAAPLMTPVYATAPGTVTFAGWMRGYGKLIEIDHGSGITTRYGHLHRYTVVVGEKVRAGTQIGLLGSTGRSTGPHVIYEIRVNGEPQNPERFLKLGHEVIAAADR